MQLRAPQAEEVFAENHVAPGTATERMVVDVFGEMLAVERVSADASFFDLGGHSILATRVVSRLRRHVHPGITLRMLFEFPTATALGREVEQLMRASSADPPREREAFEF